MKPRVRRKSERSGAVWAALALGVVAAGKARAEEAPAAPAPEGAPAALVTMAAAAPGGSSVAGGKTTAAPVVRKDPSPHAGFHFFGSLRLREEGWNWFGDDPRGEYAFTGSLLRFGVNYNSRHDDFTFELSQPTLLDLPTDASLAAPFGQLGLGAAYRDANLSQEANIFIKQGFWKHKGLGSAGNSLKAGRFEFIDGTETMPKDPSLAYLKRERIAHRLLGNFGWSHVQRSFDGGQFVRDTRGLNLTFFGGMPTSGVFDLDGNETIADVKVGYVAATHPMAAKKFQGETRVYGLYYQDERSGVIKADNRPLPVRKADTTGIGIATVGGHALGLWDVGPGKVDGLFWLGDQFGDWGRQSHHAYAFAAEAGYQPKGVPWSPWFRAGFFRGSGDDNPNDGHHDTFFPVLPTPRVYARFPFFTMTNLNDAFVQAIAKPSPKVVLRSDVHFLSLAEANDLWYAGGGAYQDEPSFGYSGRPSHGNTGLATLLDLSADYQWRKNTTLSAYFGYAFGGDVIGSIYGSHRDGFLGYFELTQKF